MTGFGKGLISRKWNADTSFMLFVLGGIAGLINLTSIVPFGAGYETVALATNLAQHGSFANPLMVLPSGPSALEPPLYPLLLALCIKVFHTPAFVTLAVSIGAVLANAITASLLPRVSSVVFDDARPGVVAGILWLMAAQLFPSWDANYTVPVLLSFCLFTGSTISKSGAIHLGLVGGLIAGFLFLLNPMSLLVFLLWLIHLLIFRSAPLKRALTYCCVVLGTVAMVAFPWALRNYRVLGKAVVRTGFGLTIYASNTDCSRTTLYEDLHSGCANLYQPNFNLHEAEALRDLGEVNYDRTRLAAAKVWMHNHPDRLLRLTASRIAVFWFPRTPQQPFRAIIIWIVTLLSLPGLIQMAYERVTFTLFTISSLLIYPLAYYVVLSDVRYRYPVLWLSLLPAGYFLVWVLRRWHARSQNASPRGAEDAPTAV